jgi:hypothetical protein
MPAAQPKPITRQFDRLLSRLTNDNTCAKTRRPSLTAPPRKCSVSQSSDSYGDAGVECRGTSRSIPMCADQKQSSPESARRWRLSAERATGVFAQGVGASRCMPSAPLGDSARPLLVGHQWRHGAAHNRHDADRLREIAGQARRGSESAARLITLDRPLWRAASHHVS